MKTYLAWLTALLLAASVCAAQALAESGIAIGDGPASAAGMDESTPADEAMEVARLEEARRATVLYYARVAAELAATGKPRELAFAATLMELASHAESADADVGQTFPRDPRIGRWRQLASVQADADVIANALLAQSGSPADAAVCGQALERWRRAEPDNLAPLLLGAEAVGSWLPSAGAYARVDLHFHDRLRWMQSVLRAHPPNTSERPMLQGHDAPPEQFATALASAILGGLAWPPMKPVPMACREDLLDATPTRRGDCRHVARILLETSDTKILSGIGSALLLGTAASAEERAEAEALRRREAWQSRQWARLASADPDGGLGLTAELLRDPAIAREQDLIERALVDSGVPLDPPADWQPSWPLDPES